MKLLQLKRPFLCAVIAEPTARGCISQIDRLERLADAFEINIPPLSFRVMRDIFSSTRRPCIATNRRPDFMKLYGYRNIPKVSEGERISKLLRGLDAGASVIDFELDAYDEVNIARKPSFGSRSERQYAFRPGSEPTEFSTLPTMVRRQRKLCETIQASGGEVLISSHTQVRVDVAKVVRIGRVIQGRGADYAKIVVFAFNSRDVITLLETAQKLRRSIRIPFNLMNVGEHLILGRLLATAFGSSWIYCRTNSPHSFPGQPTLEQAAEFLGNMP